jgi:hypothetical protein
MDYPAEEPREQHRVRLTSATRNARNDAAKEKSQPTEKAAQIGQEQPLLAHDGGDGDDVSALSQQSVEPDPSPASNSKSLLHKVRLRLGGSRISEAEFLDVLKFSRLPEAQDLTALDQVPDRILSMALEGWSTVAEIAHELRGRKTEAK